MNNEFLKYKNELKKQRRHIFLNSNHIMLEKEYQNFNFLTEEQIWGDFEDFDYENWIKEQ